MNSRLIEREEQMTGSRNRERESNIFREDPAEQMKEVSDRFNTTIENEFKKSVEYRRCLKMWLKKNKKASVKAMKQLITLKQ